VEKCEDECTGVFPQIYANWHTTGPLQVHLGFLWSSKIDVRPQDRGCEEDRPPVATNVGCCQKTVIRQEKCNRLNQLNGQAVDGRLVWAGALMED
jgi:hypothetical protein